MCVADFPHPIPSIHKTYVRIHWHTRTLDLTLSVQIAAQLGHARIVGDLLHSGALPGVRNARGVSGCVAALFWMLLAPLIALLLRVALKVDRTRRAADAARMRAVFDAAGRVLEKRAYLGGAAPSDADVCLAAIGAVAILVSPAEGYGGGACVWRMPDRGLPADMRAVYAELRASRTGAHILRMYRESRHRRVQ